MMSQGDHYNYKGKSRFLIPANMTHIIFAFYVVMAWDDHVVSFIALYSQQVCEFLFILWLATLNAQQMYKDDTSTWVTHSYDS